MATGAELTFKAAVAKAESTRQVAKAAAFNTYGFVAANLAAYLTALEAADNTYIAAVNAAASTLGAGGLSIPSGQGTNASNVSPGGQGLSIPSAMNAIGGAYSSSTMGGIP